MRTPRDAFGKSASSCNMLSSRVKMHGLKNRGNDSKANSDEGFDSELSPMESEIHLSDSASDMMDVLANSSDQEIRSNLDSSIGICSTSGKLSSKEELNNKPSHIVSKAFLPHWVYRMYDSYWLAQKAAGSFVFLPILLDIFCLFPFFGMVYHYFG